jgi:hypothetical protein
MNESDTTTKNFADVEFRPMSDDLVNYVANKWAARTKTRNEGVVSRTSEGVTVRFTGKSGALNDLLLQIDVRH